MSYMAYFSEPIVTSHGIIVGSTPNGKPYFAGNFHSITRIPSSNYNSYYQKSYEDDCISIQQIYAENCAMHEARKARDARDACKR